MASSSSSGITLQDLRSFSIEMEGDSYSGVTYESLDKEQIPGDSETCGYCRENFESTDEVTQYACRHILHKSCAEAWNGPCIYDQTPTLQRTVRVLGREIAWPSSYQARQAWSLLQDARPEIEAFIRDLAEKAEESAQSDEVKQMIADGLEIVNDLASTSQSELSTLLQEKSELYLRFASMVTSKQGFWDGLTRQVILPALKAQVEQNPEFDMDPSPEGMLSKPLAFARTVLAFIDVPRASELLQHMQRGIEGLDSRFTEELKPLKKIAERRFFLKHFHAYKERGVVERHLYLNQLFSEDQSRLERLAVYPGPTCQSIRNSLTRVRAFKLAGTYITIASMVGALGFISYLEYTEYTRDPDAEDEI